MWGVSSGFDEVQQLNTGSQQWVCSRTAAKYRQLVAAKYRRLVAEKIQEVSGS